MVSRVFDCDDCKTTYYIRIHMKDSDSQVIERKEQVYVRTAWMYFAAEVQVVNRWSSLESDWRQPFRFSIHQLEEEDEE